jgi:hypothetical protein
VHDAVGDVCSPSQSRGGASAHTERLGRPRSSSWRVLRFLDRVWANWTSLVTVQKIKDFGTFSGSATATMPGRALLFALFLTSLIAAAAGGKGGKGGKGEEQAVCQHGLNCMGKHVHDLLLRSHLFVPVLNDSYRRCTGRWWRR